MGIIAACAPTLRPGWRWLYYKLKGRNAGKGHTLLTDEVQLRPYGGRVPTVTSKNSNRTMDLESGHSFAPPPPPLPQIQIQIQKKKTTHVDVDVIDRVARAKIPPVTRF